MGSQKCRIVGKYQSVLIMINPMIFTRTRTCCGRGPVLAGCLCHRRTLLHRRGRRHHRPRIDHTAVVARYDVLVGTMGLREALTRRGR
jgi:hypothetical protein